MRYNYTWSRLLPSVQRPGIIHQVSMEATRNPTHTFRVLLSSIHRSWKGSKFMKQSCVFPQGCPGLVGPFYVWFRMLGTLCHTRSNAVCQENETRAARTCEQVGQKVTGNTQMLRIRQSYVSRVTPHGPHALPKRSLTVCEAMLDVQ